MSDRCAILAVDTISSPSVLAAADWHNRRLTVPLNADLNRLSLNLDLSPAQLRDLTFNQRLERRLAEDGIKRHRRGVLAVEMIFSMSPEAQLDVPVDKWQVAVMSAAEQIARPGNIIAANLHLDENSPHIHVLFIPVIEVVRKERGPLAKGIGYRKQRKIAVLSFAEFAGHHRDEVSRTFRGWHDIHAEAVRPFGLERGPVVGRTQHIPQKRLYALTAEIERDGEKLLKLLEDPSPLFAGLRRPTIEEQADDAKWAAYLAYVSGNAKNLLSMVKANAPSLLELAKGGLFERRAKEKIRHLDEDRNQWKARAEAADGRMGELRDAHAAEVRALECRLCELETPPLRSREVAAILGLPVITRRGRDGRPADQIVTLTGEVLTLSGDLFLRSDGSPMSVPRFLQRELGFTSVPEVYAFLASAVGEPRTLATIAAAFRHSHAVAPAKPAGIALPTAESRKRALLANLESHLGVSQKTMSRLFEENLLTVDLKGNGVLLPQGHAHGYTFKLEKDRGPVVSCPPDFAPLHLGDAGTWTQVITDDVGLALRAFDAAEGRIGSTLVPTASLTEDRLNGLKHGHRETLATPTAFVPDWNASMSAIIRPPAECLLQITEIMRSGKHPFYTDGTDSPKAPPRMEWS